MDNASHNPAFDGHGKHQPNFNNTRGGEDPASTTDNTRHTQESPPFAGIPTNILSGVAWSRLEWEPTPVATVRIVLPGGLWKEDALIEKSIIKQIATPLLSKLDSLFQSMTQAFGVTTPVLSVSPTGSNIVVLAAHVQTEAQGAKFAERFFEIIEVLRTEAQLVATIASLPAEEFSKNWFQMENRPDESLLLALRAAFKLEAFLAKCGVHLEVAGARVNIPSCQGFKLCKIATAPIERTGHLRGLQDKPQYVRVEMSKGGGIIVLGVREKGAVDAFGKNLRTGDAVRVVYQPSVELLKPFVKTPLSGKLVSMEAA